jgi:hypothetical protein
MKKLFVLCIVLCGGLSTTARSARHGINSYVHDGRRLGVTL